jgi:hypothetical protein
MHIAQCTFNYGNKQNISSNVQKVRFLNLFTSTSKGSLDVQNWVKCIGVLYS